MTQKRKNQIAGILFVVFSIVTIIGIWIFNSYQNDGKTNPNNFPKLIEVADSIKNSKPDSALFIYNHMIDQISNSEVKRNDSLFLALAHTGIASTYLSIGDSKNAFLHDSIAEAISLKCNDNAVISKVYLCKGTIYSRISEYEKARACYDDAMAFANKNKDSLQIAKVLSNQAMLYYNQGEIQKTIYIFREALDIGKHVKNDALIANNYLNLAIVYSYQNMNDSVVVFNTLATNIFKKSNDKIGESSCYRNLGSYYYEISDYKNAIANFQLALYLSIEAGDQLNMAKGYHNLSEMYARIGDNNLATELLDKSIEIKERLGDKRSLANGYLAVGNLHYNRNNYTEALQYYKKSLAIFLDKELKGDVGKAYSYIGNALSGLQKNDSAVFYYNKAIESYKQIGNVLGLTNLYLNIGDVFRIKSEYEKSEKYFIQALNSKRHLNDEEGVTLVNYYLANLYLDQSKFAAMDFKIPKLQLAERAALQSYQKAKHLGLKPIMQEVSQTLMKTYEKMGKYREALNFSKEYNALSDSILDKSKIEALTFAEARWNVANEQREIENLKNIQRYNDEIIKQKVIEARQHKFIIWIIVAFSVVIGIFVLFFALYVKRRRNALYQKQLASITMLRMQNIRNALSPHFVFNVLNNIWAIIDDRENARMQFDNLTNLIRRSLINTEKLAIPLSDEIDFVKSFVALQKLRMDDDLKVVWSIGNEIKLTQHVPGMILQIPVENAIKHGLAPKKDNRVLQIDLKNESGFLHFIIADNGAGLQQTPSSTKGTGTGLKVLKNTIHILNQINENKMSYEILNRNEEQEVGTKVIIKIPLNYNYNLN